MAKDGTIIIGGGVIGLALGWRLALKGEQVTLLERGLVGSEASWVGAGMLAPATEFHPVEDENLALGRESMRLYPQFVAELEAATGQNVDYRTEGALAVALDADDASALKRHFESQQAFGLPVHWMGGDEAREREPSLANYITAAVLCEMDHQVDNRKLLPALRAGLEKAGGEVHENTEVDGFLLENEICVGVKTKGSEWRGSRVVVAAGSWSGMVPGLPEIARPPVRPVKGQILAVTAPAPDFLTHVIRTPDCYFAPKSDGRVVVGATMEEMGFDRANTAGGVYQLLKAAWETIPGIYDLPLMETKVGFRPGSRDNAPILGASAVPGLFMATGHHRGGVLFTPATAIHMTTLLLEGTTPEPLLPFNPLRFSN